MINMMEVFHGGSWLPFEYSLRGVGRYTSINQSGLSNIHLWVPRRYKRGHSCALVLLLWGSMHVNADI